MKRKDFIIRCSAGCLGISAFSLFQSCAGAKIINASILNDSLLVPLKEFEMEKKGRISYRPYVIARNPRLQYPVCIYRHQPDDYSALLMKCTHQGTELQVFGDKLQCPAHGSEFANRGKVTNGPADTDLRSFPVTIQNQQLFISLR